MADAGGVDVLGPLVEAEDVAATWAELDTDRQRAVVATLPGSCYSRPAGYPHLPAGDRGDHAPPLTARPGLPSLRQPRTAVPLLDVTSMPLAFLPGFDVPLFLVPLPLTRVAIELPLLLFRPLRIRARLRSARSRGDAPGTGVRVLVIEAQRQYDLDPLAARGVLGVLASWSTVWA